MSKNLKITAIAVIMAAVLCLLSGCGLFASDKEFSAEGLTITLTSAFTEEEIETQTVCYQSPKAVVTGLKEDFTLFEDAGLSTDISLEDYANMVLLANSLDSEIKTENGLTYFEYEKEVEGVDFKYFATVFKGSDAYWLVQFASKTGDYDSMKDYFVKWAGTVKV